MKLTNTLPRLGLLESLSLLGYSGVDRPEVPEPLGSLVPRSFLLSLDPEKSWILTPSTQKVWGLVPLTDVHKLLSLVNLTPERTLGTP